MLFQAHRGVSSEYPENTLSAFRAAVIQGYDIIELDPSFTSDLQCVVFHDKTISRTLRCRNRGLVPEDLPISSLTFEELLSYDAGIYKNPRFLGEKVPLLSEALEEAGDVPVKIDNRIFKFTEEQREILFEVVKCSRARIIWTCPSMDAVRLILSRFPTDEIHYDGPVNEEALIELKNICKPENNLLVWLPLQCSLTTWVKVPFVSDELAALVHRYARLGLWILGEESDLALAEHVGADLIETTGVLKPRNVLPGFVDCHVHSEYSADAKPTISEILQSATKKRLSGVFVTDHYGFQSELGRQSSVSKMDRIVEAFHQISVNDSCFLRNGCEIGESLMGIDFEHAFVSRNRPDLVNGSVHFVPFEDCFYTPFSRVDFSRFDLPRIKKYLSAYFDAVLATVAYADLDVVCHLTVPLRYISGRYGFDVSLDDFSDEIDKVLLLTIQRNLSLEVNTSCMGSEYDELLPNKKILQRYFDLGGRKITLASDAHNADRVGFAFDETWNTLKKIGFNRLYFYNNRIPVPYVLESDTELN